MIQPIITPSPAPVRSSSRKTSRFIRLLPLLPMMALTAGCDDKSVARSPPPIAQVGFVVVHPQPLLRMTELPGRTTAALTADVRPQVSGVILKRLFREGSEVKEGEQLYQIDPATYQATYDSAVATLSRNQAALVAANAKLYRYKSLAAAKAVSTQDYDDATATAKEVEADIETARANITQAKINLAYTKVLAPISGRIGRSTVTPGALVIANQTTVLATVTQLDPIYVDVTQSATTLLRLQKELAKGEIESAGGGAAKVTLKLEDGSDYEFPGKLQFAEVTVDEGTGTVLLRAIFPNPKRLLLPGMYVHAHIQEGINRNGILIPQQAVSRNTHGDATVFVVSEDGKASLRVVQTSQARDDQWIVTGGLSAGERVIVDGLQNIRPGDTVQAVLADAPPAAVDKKS